MKAIHLTHTQQARNPGMLPPHIEAALHEGLAVHEMLRRLAFASDDIYLVLADNGGIGVCVREADQVAHVLLLDEANRGDVPDAQIIARWQTLANRYNTDGIFAHTVYTSARAPKEGYKLVMHLLQKGFRARWTESAISKMATTQVQATTYPN